MSAADVVLAFMFAGLTAYALFGGADFGAGIWDLVAGGDQRGMAPRRLITQAIGPVWEANHVWLIFVLVVLWTGFPPAFAAVASMLYLPLTAAALGMIARGSAFAFRNTVPSLAMQRLLGAAFAFSSVVTPFFLGTVAGGVASGRVPPGIAKGNVITSWLNPTSLLGGVLAAGTCAYLAAVFLAGDARREGDAALSAWFRTRALVTAVVVGLVALAGIAILHADAPRLFDALLTRGLPLVVVSGLCGLTALLLVRRLPPRAVQGLAVLAVTAVIAGWGTAQYPYLLGTHTTIAQAAAPVPTLVSLTVVAAVALLVVVPSMALLFVLAQRGSLESSH
jgi:cytochrome bd ubiquinol oxidase subunit II